jgi:hypothetical protein
MPDRENPGFDLLFRVVLSAVALRQASQGERQRKEIEEFPVVSLKIVGIGHSAGSFRVSDSFGPGNSRRLSEATIRLIVALRHPRGKRSLMWGGAFDARE